MKATDIQIELRNYKIRQGYLYKRSRIMRQWRKRWIVLTMNFLFSFESQKCGKPTEIIDLKQVASLKTMLKLNEDIFTNCFLIQTKSTDFAIATREIVQKWSWIVTFQRLFDFKERGASDHNSIDHMRKEGFLSQQEFQYRRFYKAKNDLNIGNTKNFQQECKKREEKANQILQQLIQQQQKLNAKEQQLLSLESVLQQKNMLVNQKIQTLQAQLNLKREDPKASTGQKMKPTKRQQFQDRPSIHQFEVKMEQTTTRFQLSQNMRLTRSKCIQHIFDEFHTTENREQLNLILQFLLKISEKQSYSFRPMLAYQTHNHKHFKNFIHFLFSYAENVNNSALGNIGRLLIFFKIVFAENTTTQPQIAERVLDIISKWSSLFDGQTQLKLLIEYLNFVLLMIKLDKPKTRQKLASRLHYVAQLSQDAQYRKLSNQMLHLLQN